jgi:hypothetical protein
MAVRVVPGARLRRAALGRPLALTTFFAAAAAVSTWPGIRGFGSSFISLGGDGHGEPVAGDHFQAIYRFWLAARQLEHGAAPWRDPYSFQPLVDHQTVLGAWPFALPFWPLDALFGPVVAWNLLLLGTIATAGLLTYAWLRSLGVATAAALVGGLAFAIAPYRLAQSGVHLLGWVAIFVPLALLAVERARSAETRRSAHAWGALAALALVSIPLSGQVHLALGALPFVLAYALVRLDLVPAVWVLAGVAAAACVGIAIRYTLIAGSIEEGGRSLAEVGNFSAEPLDLLSRWRLGGLEDFVYLGWLTPLLAAVGIVVLWRRGRPGLSLLLAVTAIVPPLLALGTHLPVYSWLWHAFPPLRYPRVPGRFVPLSDLALAALAAFAVEHAVRRAGRRSGAAAAALLVLVALDLIVLPLKAAVADQDNRAYRALRTTPAGRVLDLPLFEPGVHYASVYDYYALQAPRQRLSGYSTLAPAEAYDFYFAYNRLSCGVWLPGDDRALESRGVRYAVFHRGMFAQGRVPGAWFGWRGLVDHGFAPLAADGAITVFARGRGDGGTPPPVPEPSRRRPLLCEGWRGRTMDERQAPLWVYGEGTLTLRVGTTTTNWAGLWVDGARLPDVRVRGRATLRASLKGERWHAVVLEVPRLTGTTPPRGLRLLDLDLS